MPVCFHPPWCATDEDFVANVQPLVEYLKQHETSPPTDMEGEALDALYPYICQALNFVPDYSFGEQLGYALFTFPPFNIVQWEKSRLCVLGRHYAGTA